MQWSTYRLAAALAASHCHRGFVARIMTIAQSHLRPWQSFLDPLDRTRPRQPEPTFKHPGPMGSDHLLARHPAYVPGDGIPGLGPEPAHEDWALAPLEEPAMHPGLGFQQTILGVLPVGLEASWVPGRRQRQRMRFGGPLVLSSRFSLSFFLFLSRLSSSSQRILVLRQVSQNNRLLKDATLGIGKVCESLPLDFL
jgi:hypothetical protein